MAALLILVLFAAPALAQSTASDTIREAERLRAEGDLEEAARLLAARVQAHPEDGDAIRVLAQTFYWLEDLDRARQTYERAMVRHPMDTRLRLDFGRMLVETGDRARARAVLAPLLELPAARAEAGTLLGTLAYWEGDLTRARNLFAGALEASPAQDDARRQLQEIRALTASWIGVTPGLRHDDQPLDRLSVGLEAGWFATPLLPIKARVEPMRYGFSGATRTLWSTEVEASHFMPELRLETELAGGMLRRSGEGGTDWTGRGAAAVRLPHHLKAGARVERAPYLYTTASLRLPVLTDMVSARLGWNDPRGWLGEAAYQRQAFGDGNAVRTRYAWLLAPVVRRPGLELQAGYAFARDNADENRFVLAEPEQPFPPGDPRFSLEGVYEPYYTPSHLVTHAAIAAVKIVASPETTLRLGGSYAIRATEDAPAFVVTGATVHRVLVPRELSPWNARASLEIAAGTRVTVGLTGEAGRTAFYHWATAGLQLLYRFNASAPR